jgi:hypothetical protein
LPDRLTCKILQPTTSLKKNNTSISSKRGLAGFAASSFEALPYMGTTPQRQMPFYQSSSSKDSWQ